VDAQTNKARFPPGLHNGFIFSSFNALSFQIILGSPMVLYAKTLGASATVLGVIAGMMPLLVISQIPAAAYIPRIGFKRFVVGGWSTRVVFIFLMAVVPLLGLLPRINHGSQLALLLLLLFCFNLSRGISSCAWLPWITSLIPAEIRGRYLSFDTACINGASFVTILLSALVLGAAPQPWQFSVIILFSAAMGALSLIFLRRIPDGQVPAEENASRHSVPWREISAYPPFRKLLWAVVGWAVAYGGLSAFSVAFLKTEVGMTEGRILLLSSTIFLGGLSSLWFLGPRLDRLGSKPVLGFSLTIWLAILFGWLCLSGRALRPGAPLIVGLMLLMGLFASLVQMATTRLAMVVIPVTGRNHFFALYSVVANVALGLAPVLWGLVIDAFGSVGGRWLGLEWNRYSLFFAAVTICMLVALALTRRLEEPAARGMEELLRDILNQTPLRWWIRLWPRS